MRPDLPTGTVTFLFTDVEGSTRLLHELGAEGYAEALAEHRRLIRDACAAQGGVEVDTQGDAFFFAFPTAPGAITAAGVMTEALAAGPISVRIGLHTGTPLLTEEGYVGDDVHFAARVASSGHGGQVVLSAATAELCEASLTSLGSHRLKDIQEPVSIFQLGERTFPPLKTIANSNLPTPASSFLGRAEELYQADLLLQETRLLTVTGPGGQGKTRFSLELARRAREERFSDYRDGVFSSFFSSLRDPSLVLATIATTLSVREQSGQPALEALTTHLEGKQMLVLLDNLEHLLEAASELSSLLSACPGLTLLVTSRELLRVQGEHSYELPPLRTDEGVSLFCARSQLEPTETIHELCARLEGLPLAIELAAARTRIMTPEQLLERLSSRLDLLKGGRDADPRQATLRATIEWSYDLLTPEEQQLFARLSVFAGGCTLEAAEEVCDADIDTLQSLVDKSLLRFTDGRYWLLETIREYTVERLEESGDRDELEDRHAAYMFQRYGQMPREGPQWVSVLEAERDNLRAATRWALTRGGPERALTLAEAYGALCRSQGPFREGRYWLDATLDTFPDAAVDLRWRVLYASSNLAAVDGDLDVAEIRAEEALRVGRTMGDMENTAKSIRALGIVAADKGQLEESGALQREAMAMFMEGGNDREVIESLGLLAFLAVMREDWPSARSSITDALTRSRALGYERGVLRNVSNLGHVLVREERYREALPPLGESVLLAHEQSDAFGLAAQLEDLAGAAVGLRRFEEASVLLGGSEELLDRTGRSANPVFGDWRGEITSRLRAELDEERLSVNWQGGRNMTADELVEYALAFVDAV